MLNYRCQLSKYCTVDSLEITPISPWPVFVDILCRLLILPGLSLFCHVDSSCSRDAPDRHCDIKLLLSTIVPVNRPQCFLFCVLKSHHFQPLQSLVHFKPIFKSIQFHHWFCILCYLKYKPKLAKLTRFWCLLNLFTCPLLYNFKRRILKEELLLLHSQCAW